MTDRRPFALPGATSQYGPDRVVRVEHIHLELHPDLDAKSLAGFVTTTVRAIEDGVKTLVMDAVDMDVKNVARYGDGILNYAFTQTAKHLTIALDAPLARGESLAFRIEYFVQNPQRGLYFIDSPRQAWTQSQDTDARSWLPCFDHPSEKQATSTAIFVEPGLFALGNGALVSRKDVDGKTEFRYEQSVPHATYLLTMVAGDFTEIPQTHERVPMFYYVVPGREADGERAFANTPKMIDTFEDAIGVPYPYDRYSQIAVAEFIFGGMENTSATTQTDRTLHDERAHLDFSSDSLVSHELAHQWFGDYVTCRDWSQAWLNEGFATYFETVWREANLGWDEYQRDIFEITGEYLDEDGERYSRPIVCNVYRDPIELFDRHLYQKGGAVLHMLRGELGWDRMKRSLRRYVSENGMRTVETIDLVRAIEAETGRNMRGFFDQWIDRAGHPELEVRCEWDEGAFSMQIEIEQKQTIDDDRPPYAFDMSLGIVTGGAKAPIARDAGDGPITGEHRLRVHVKHAREKFSIACAVKPDFVRVDPGAYVLCTMTYAMGTEAHAAILASDPSTTARIRAAKAFGKDGSMTAQRALVKALETEPFWGVAAEIALVLGAARAPFAREALVRATTHAHPKVRRAVADALGTYREGAGDALLGLLGDPSYFVVATALTALGKTRDPRAFDALIRALDTPSWADTIAAGAVRGLAELADARALEPMLATIARERSESLRRAGVGALARLAVLVDSVRTAVVEAIAIALEDRAYLVRVAAYGAAECIADARLLPLLDRLASAETDGRLRRDATEAAMHVRAAATTPPEVVRLREEVDRLRDDLNRLRERVDAPTA